MLNERKLTERELGKRVEAIKGLMSNKRKLVKKYGKDAEKVMYGIATKQAKNKVESMNKDKIRELVKQSLLKKEGFVNTTPLGEPESGQEVDIDTGFSGRADYGAEDKSLGGEDEIEQSSASTPPSGRATFLPGVPTPTEEGVVGSSDLDIPASTMVKYNSAVKNAKTAAESILAFYDQMIEKETMDFSKNPKMRVAIDRLRDLAKSEDKEDLAEIGGYDRKGNKEMDDDDEGLKKRPQAGISALLKSAVREKLTKKSSVEDHVDDFKDSNAKQFKGKSLKKIKQMALASFLSKQND